MWRSTIYGSSQLASVSSTLETVPAIFSVRLVAMVHLEDLTDWRNITCDGTALVENDQVLLNAQDEEAGGTNGIWRVGQTKVDPMPFNAMVLVREGAIYRQRMFLRTPSSGPLLPLAGGGGGGGGGDTYLMSENRTTGFQSAFTSVTLPGPNNTAGSLTTRYLLAGNNIGVTAVDNNKGVQLSCAVTALSHLSDAFVDAARKVVAVGTRGPSTSSNRSVVVGSTGALGSASTGNDNTAVGADALGRATTGAGNVAVGGNAAAFVTTGSNNVFLGNSAGLDVRTGSSNVIIGQHAGTDGLTNTVVLASGVGRVCASWNTQSDLSLAISSAAAQPVLSATTAAGEGMLAVAYQHNRNALCCRAAVRPTGATTGADNGLLFLRYNRPTVTIFAGRIESYAVQMAGGVMRLGRAQYEISTMMYTVTGSSTEPGAGAVQFLISPMPEGHSQLGFDVDVTMFCEATTPNLAISFLRLASVAETLPATGEPVSDYGDWVTYTGTLAGITTPNRLITRRVVFTVAANAPVCEDGVQRNFFAAPDANSTIADMQPVTVIITPNNGTMAQNLHILGMKIIFTGY